jgi:ribA/ribD-fused uncharacterized protein
MIERHVSAKGPHLHVEWSMSEQRRLEWLFELGRRVARLEAAGEVLEVLAFEGNQPATDDSHLLSHWAVTPFVIDGVCYPTLSHLLMAGRAQLFADTAARLRILRSPEPEEAERLGYAVRGADDGAWAGLRSTLLYRGNLCKALQNQGARRALLGSGDAVIVSAGVSERVMGVGLRRDDSSVRLPDKWLGLNLLGLALMDVRERLRQGDLQFADPS